MSGDSAARRSLGPCPICGREMIEGPSVNRHHWVPRLKGGGAASDIHVVCHRMLHRTFSEGELARDYPSPEALRAHPEIENFIRWVRRKPVEFVDRAKAPRGRDKRRPHRRSR
ncbi:MAG: hypothetical protein VW835_03600 [Rickettsiales bacterium]